jgi:hypothetical protein
MNKIQIHEDDEGMRRLHPKQAIDDITVDLTASSEHSEKHRAPGGVGWTKVYSIRSPELTFNSLGVPVSIMAETLERHLTRIRQFELGFGENNPFHYLETDAHCYGLGAHLYIKIDVDGDMIESVWYEALPKDREELLKFRHAIEAVNAVLPLSCADYWLHMGGSVEDQDFMDQYCKKIARSSYERANTDKLTVVPPHAKQNLSIWQRLFGKK